MTPGELTGTVLDGRYKVLERIAAGAMGVVYRGERIKLGRAVAIKFLHAALADEPARRQRFEIEARAMARLDHPNCAAVIDVGIHTGMPYVVMDYIPGRTLRDVLDDGRVEPGRAIALIRQILWGLAHAHELGIVHRDVKPANVMLTERAGLGEQARLLDFGLARLQEGSGLTAGMAIGTPSYMAPEQIAGGQVDARTDLYACGILLFELLAGDKPFVADEPVEVLRMQLHAAPPPLSSVAPDLPFGAALDAVVARALAKAPDDRYGSALDFAAAIDAAVGGVAAPRAAAGPAAIALTPAAPGSVAALMARHGRAMPAAITVAVILLIGVIARLAT